jgi:hypothetical protein
MHDADLVQRVEMLEETVSALRQLPARVGVLELRVGAVESQILHLRSETRAGFSAIHETMATKAELAMGLGVGRKQVAVMGVDLRSEIAAMKVGLRQEIAAMKVELREDIAALGRELTGHILETQRQMRVLFEEHISRRRVTDEGVH